MVPTENGLIPDFRLPEKIQQHFSGSLKNVALSFVSSKQPIDSSAVTPQHWAEWIDETRRLVATADGIIILHGTDTMAYTAALFRQIFADGNKAIIFTGSQKAWVEEASDAPDNVLSSIRLIQQGFSGVGLVFYRTLFDPADCRKITTQDTQAFTPIWRSPLARFLHHQWQIFRQPERVKLPTKCLSINPNIRIATLYPTPYMPLKDMAKLLSSQTDAAIILAYGNGNLPDDDEFLTAAQDFCQQGKPMILLSQVWQGESNRRYAANSALLRIGAINGGQCTLENALAKLWVAISVKLSPDEMVSLFA